MNQKRPKKITKKFEKMCEIYRIFSYDGWRYNASFTEEDKLELFYAETFGDTCKSNNGFAIGKRFMDITVAGWIEERDEGLLPAASLYGGKFPTWWLNNVLNRDGPYNNGCYDATEENWQLRTRIMETENRRLEALVNKLNRDIDRLQKRPWYSKIFNYP